MLKLLKKKADPKVGPDYMVLNLGPHHPASSRNLRNVVQLDGETLLRCVPQSGFLHCGFEKLAESLELAEFLDLIDRKHLLTTPAIQLSMIEAIESLLRVDITERCAYIRVFIAELARIAEHLRALALLARDVGADLIETALITPAVRADAMIRRFAGESGGSLFVRIGGLATDVPEGVTLECDEVFEEIESGLRLVDKMLTRNRVFVNRTKAVGALTREEVDGHGLSGPTARATGVATDLRRDQPYLVYDRIAFDVAVGSHGDAFDRFLVRVAEIRESMHIARETLHMLPPGRLETESKIPESLPEGELYRATESSEGELGCFLSSTGGKGLHRMRLRSPSLYHYQVFGQRAAGLRLSDAMTFLASLNIQPLEVDR